MTGHAPPRPAAAANVDPSRDAEAVAFLSELVALAERGEGAVQAAVAAALARLGCEIETVRYDPRKVVLREEFASEDARDAGEREAVLARLRGQGGGRSLILFAHPDCEPPKALERWATPPFAATRIGPHLHGFGVADDLSGVAMLVSGLAAALADGAPMRGDVLVASTPSKRHARGVAAVLARVPAPDAALYAHPAESGRGLGEIKACTPGLLEFRITLPGRAPDTAEPGHAAFAHQALDPVVRAERALMALRRLDAERGARVRHARIEAAVGRATNLLVSSVRAGGGSRNRIASEAVIEGSVSFPPGETLRGVMAEVEAALSGAGLDDAGAALAPQLEWLAGVGAAEIAADHPLFLAAAAAVEAETGMPAIVNPVHTASDIRVPMNEAGIPTVGLGPLGGNLAMNGEANEWVDAADHARAVRAVARLIRAWCA